MGDVDPDQGRHPLQWRNTMNHLFLRDVYMTLGGLVPEWSSYDNNYVVMSGLGHWSYLKGKQNSVTLILTMPRFCKACNESNLMHYLSSLYWVTIPLHVSCACSSSSGDNNVYICDNWYVLYFLVDCPSRPANSRLRHITHTKCHTYTLLSWWWATSKPETCRGIVTE
jgi:hypothetical protein